MSQLSWVMRLFFALHVRGNPITAALLALCPARFARF